MPPIRARLLFEFGLVAVVAALERLLSGGSLRDRSRSRVSMIYSWLAFAVSPKVGSSDMAQPLAEHRTILDVTAERLDRLCEAADFPSPVRANVGRVLTSVFASWAHRPIGVRPPHDSDISDDHFPVEMSLALTGSAPEVRVLFEAQAPAASMAALWSSGQAVNERFEGLLGLSLERLRSIEDLFLPTARDVRWAMWHSLCFDASGRPTGKVYLNPQACGRERAAAVVAEALSRLGCSAASLAVTTRARSADEIKFFSLDLDVSPAARVKVYKVHRDATRGDIDAEMRLARDCDPDALADFWTSIVEGDGPFRGLPISTYLALTQDNGQPTGGAVQFPVRDYVAHDAEVHRRVVAFLGGSDRDTYERAVRAFSTRPLDAGVGLHSYVAIRPNAERRLTVYLAIEAYAVSHPRVHVGAAPRAARMSSSPMVGAPGLAGQLRRDPLAIGSAAGDVGGLVTAAPAAVLRPRSAADVVSAVRHCAARRLPVAARGQGHTTYGQSLAEDGLVIDMSSLSTIHRIDSDSAVIDAGVTWRRLLEETTQRRLTPPVLTAFQGLSVGGTLSVGGLSGASCHRGAQVDHVLELDVVTGNGEFVRCSAAEDGALFDAVLAGLGQCAIIVRATVRLVKAPARVRHTTIVHDTLGGFIAQLRELAARRQLDGLSGTIVLARDCPPRYEVNAYGFFTPPEAPANYPIAGPRTRQEAADFDYLDFYLQVDRAVERARESGLWEGVAHPWFDVFVPDRGIDEYLASILAELDVHDVGPTELGSLGQIHLFPLETRHLRRPLLRMPAGDLVFLFDILTSAHAPGRDPEYVARMLARNRRFFDRGRTFGATRYSIAAIPFSRADWQRQLGPGYDRLAAQKRRHDPTGILGPSIGMF